MADAVLVGAGIEVIRMALQVYLTLVAQAGMTEEQINTMLATERQKFYANRPDTLPKPPEEG